MILGGDIGGTKCNLALFERRNGCLTAIFRRRYESQEVVRFEDVITSFLGDARDILAQPSGGKVLAAGFGVAGPVIGRRVQPTNLPWSLDAGALARQLGTPHIVLLNDLEATGYAMAVLGAEDFCTLNAGTPAPESPRAVLAAGTGLGEAILIWNGSRYVVVPTEGGHCDFAPRSEQEIELLRYHEED